MKSGLYTENTPFAVNLVVGKMLSISVIFLGVFGASLLQDVAAARCEGPSQWEGIVYDINHETGTQKKIHLSYDAENKRIRGLVTTMNLDLPQSVIT